MFRVLGLGNFESIKLLVKIFAWPGMGFKVTGQSRLVTFGGSGLVFG